MNLGKTLIVSQVDQMDCGVASLAMVYTCNSWLIYESWPRRLADGRLLWVL